MIAIYKVMAKMTSQDARTRGLKLNYQASELKTKSFLLLFGFFIVCLVGWFLFCLVFVFTQCIFKLQILLLQNFMAVKIINRFKNNQTDSLRNGVLNMIRKMQN